jgi:hypothetical protein
LYANFFIKRTPPRDDSQSHARPPAGKPATAKQRLASRCKLLRHDPRRRGVLRLIFLANFDARVTNRVKHFCSPDDVETACFSLPLPAASNPATPFLFPISNIQRSRSGARPLT